jgi:hypothetical protein
MLDNSAQISDNGNNDENEIVTRMDESPPINDVSCTHESLIARPEDTIGEAIYHECANYRCGVGFYIQPAKNKNIT